MGQRDLPRLLVYFNMEKADFLARYTEIFDGKPVLITGEDDFCYFLKRGGAAQFMRHVPMFAGLGRIFAEI